MDELELQPSSGCSVRVNDRTQAAKDHVPLYVAKEQSPVDEKQVDELLMNGVHASAGGGDDLLAAQAKVGIFLHIWCNVIYIYI